MKVWLTALTHITVCWKKIGEWFKCSDQCNLSVLIAADISGHPWTCAILDLFWRLCSESTSVSFTSYAFACEANMAPTLSVFHAHYYDVLMSRGCSVFSNLKPSITGYLDTVSPVIALPLTCRWRKLLVRVQQGVSHGNQHQLLQTVYPWWYMRPHLLLHVSQLAWKHVRFIFVIT